MNGKANPAVVEMRGLSTRIGNRYVHRNLDLRVERGQIVGLVGGSGSGKTTLLRQILGLIQPAAGTVRLFGQDLGGAGGVAQSAMLRRLGMLFQGGALFSALPVFDNIAFPLREMKRLDEDWIRRLVNLKLALVELETEHGRLMPAELSGGMVKRVALARALALEPEVLLLDQPTLGADARSCELVFTALDRLHDEGTSILCATEEVSEVVALCDRVAIIHEGCVLAEGTTEELIALCRPYWDAEAELTRRFLARSASVVFGTRG